MIFGMFTLAALASAAVPRLDGIFLSLYSANLNYSAAAWADEFAAMRAVGIRFAAVRAALQGTATAENMDAAAAGVAEVV